MLLRSYDSIFTDLKVKKARFAVFKKITSGINQKEYYYLVFCSFKVIFVVDLLVEIIEIDADFDVDAAYKRR